MLSLNLRLKSREVGGGTLLRETRCNVRDMFLAGEKTLPRLQRRMGVLNNKVYVLKKKEKLPTAREMGLVEEEVEGQHTKKEEMTVRALQLILTQDLYWLQ